MGLASATRPWLRTARYCAALLCPYIMDYPPVLTLPLLKALLDDELELALGLNSAVR